MLGTMGFRLLIVIFLLVGIGTGLSACADRRTRTYLWMPAADVNDP